MHRCYFVNKGLSSQGYGFSSSHVWMWELDYKESWVLKNWCFWIIVLEKTLGSPLDGKDIQPVYPKGNRSWIFIGRTDVEAETPILWPPDVKNWLIWKDPDAGKDWRWEEKRRTEDELIGWHHWLNRHEFEYTPGVGDGQRDLVCCSPWDCKESDMTERWNWTEPQPPVGRHKPQDICSTAACLGRTQTNHQQASTSPGTHWAPTPLASRLTQASGHPRYYSQLCQKPAPSTRGPTPALGSLGPAARHQVLALLISGMTLVLDPKSNPTHQWASTSPGPLRILQTATSWPSPANKQPAASAQGRAWQPTEPRQSHLPECPQ